MDIFGFVPQFGGLVWTLVAFVAALSVIVAVHEYGHYIVGRWSGIHAEVFSLGFGPVLLSRADRHGTRWQIAALPFGGYVRFLGDGDAASARGDDKVLTGLSPEQRRATMHGAPLWARAATVAAGPMFNFILSVVIFAGLFLSQGVATEDSVVGEPKALPGVAQPLLPGDRVLALAGQPTPTLAALLDVAGTLPPAPAADYRLLRQGAEIDLQGPFPLPPVADAVQPQSAAMAAGLQVGDVVLAVDGVPVHAFAQLREIVGASDGRSLTLRLWRAGDEVEVTLTPRRMDLPLPDGGFETRWLIGLSGGLAFVPELRTPGPVEAVGLALTQVGDLMRTSLSGLWHMVTGAISSCNLQGPIGIAETSGAAASQGLVSFIWFIAMLSTAVGLLNLFPVPVLDGGHLVFHVWEATTGKPPSDRALRILMSAGLAILLTLMVFALTNDLFCP
ncbi:MAG: RIP metalloprotease RseP [Rhodobacterales bacterium]|nr:RIP metalloprotease RseP [Rhodobacterales bacterium]